MPDLITGRKFLQDLDRLKSRNQIMKNVRKHLGQRGSGAIAPGSAHRADKKRPNQWSELKSLPRPLAPGLEKDALSPSSRSPGLQLQ